MSTIGRIASITQYPVKSMAGEVLERAFLNSHGLEHDRLYAFESSGAPPGMLRLTGRERRRMLQYQARLTMDGRVEVLTPGGERYPVDSPGLLSHLQALNDQQSRLTLSLSDTPQTDVRPLSLLSVETVQTLSQEFGETLDARRFRANLLLTLDDGPFAEEQLQERTPRCRFITYAPEAPLEAEPLFPLMKLLDRRHEGRAGIYASVLIPGWIRPGDELKAIRE